MINCDKQSLGRMICFTALDIRNIAKKVLAPYELTLEQFQTFKILSQNPGMSQRQLAQETNKSPANMTRILDRLEIKSLIARRTDSSDRRVYLVYLTDKGRSLLNDVLEVFERFSSRLNKGVSKEMQEITKETLRIMTANIATMSTGTGKTP